MEKSKLEKLKFAALQLLKFGTEDKPETEKPKEEKFDSVKIKDGETMIDYNPSLEIGTPVMISGGTGSTPASDGTYTLSNGVIFVVKDGKIESVTDKGTFEEDKTKTEDKEKNEVVEKMSAEITELKETVRVLSENFAKLDFSKLPTNDQLESFSKNVVEFGTQINTVIEEFSTMPVHVPENIKTDNEKDELTPINFSAVADFLAQKREQE